MLAEGDESFDALTRIVDTMATRVAFRYIDKETKQSQVTRLARLIREATGISKGKSEEIADAIYRKRDLEALALQKSWPVNEQGDIEGPRGSLSFDDARNL